MAATPQREVSEPEVVESSDAGAEVDAAVPDVASLMVADSRAQDLFRGACAAHGSMRGGKGSDIHAPNASQTWSRTPTHQEPSWSSTEC